MKAKFDKVIVRANNLQKNRPSYFICYGTIKILNMNSKNKLFLIAGPLPLVLTFLFLFLLTSQELGREIKNPLHPERIQQVPIIEKYVELGRAIPVNLKSIAPHAFIFIAIFSLILLIIGIPITIKQIKERFYSSAILYCAVTVMAGLPFLIFFIIGWFFRKGFSLVGM